MILFLLLLLVPIQVHGLDSETNDPVYKFVVVEGEPAALNTSEIIEVKDFDECVDKCEQNTQCVLAYQSNSSESCYLFEWDSVQQIIKNESGGVGTVAFKVYTDQPACDLNEAFLLNGKIYPITPNNPSSNLWRISTDENGWTITYIRKSVSDLPTCGNFSYNRPYIDGCQPECQITMVQVSAELESSSQDLQEATPTTWTDCLYWCHNNTDCMLVTFDKTCKWLKTGENAFLKKTEAADGKQAAIKIPLNETTCKMTTDKLLDDQSYGTPPMRVETDRDGWAITSKVFCGNNGDDTNRPYADGCNSECNFTQIQVSAFPGPLTRNTNTTQVQSWRECMRFCYKTKRCFVAYYQDSNPTACSYWFYSDIFFFNRTEPSTGHHMMIKAFMNNKSCLLTTEELLNDQYYLPNMDLVGYRTYNSFYRLQTTDKYYKFVHYIWEYFILDNTRNSGCQDQFLPSYRWNLAEKTKKNKLQLCVLQQKWPGVTQPQAKEICKEFEGDLIPERTLGAPETCHAAGPILGDFNFLTIRWTWPLGFQDDWGFPEYQTENIKVWYGLEKDPADKTWKYTRQDWVIVDNETLSCCVTPFNTAWVDRKRKPDRETVANQTYMTWAPGEPKDLPDYNCAYLSYNYLQGEFPFYALYSAPCNYTGVTGFSCGTEIQLKKGVKTYKEVRADYGLPYSTSHLEEWGYVFQDL